MENINPERNEQESVVVTKLGEFDRQYFQEIEGEDGWLALDQEYCRNQQYFTVFGSKREKLGIVGVFDAADELNAVHPVVDKKFRGQGLAAQFMLKLMDDLNLPFITMIIPIDHTASIRATEKIPGVRKVSDKHYEEEFRKVKYVCENPHYRNPATTPSV